MRLGSVVVALMVAGGTVSQLYKYTSERASIELRAASEEEEKLAVGVSWLVSFHSVHCPRAKAGRGRRLSLPIFPAGKAASVLVSPTHTAFDTSAEERNQTGELVRLPTF